MSIGTLFFGKSFGNVFLFGVSVLMLEYYYMKFLIKYNFWSFFDEMSIMEFFFDEIKY